MPRVRGTRTWSGAGRRTAAARGEAAATAYRLHRSTSGRALKTRPCHPYGGKAAELGGEPREMLLAAEDYSAVSRRVPLSKLYERGRALGIGVQVSADIRRNRVLSLDGSLRSVTLPVAGHVPVNDHCSGDERDVVPDDGLKLRRQEADLQGQQDYEHPHDRQDCGLCVSGQRWCR
jgi:hypothetical protein